MEAFTAFKVIGAAAGGLAKHSQGMTDAARQDSEALLAETQALQRDANLRDELTRFLSTTQASRSANGLSATSPNALVLMNEANLVSNNERMIQSSDDRQRAANLRAGAKASRTGARFSLLTGVASAGIPLAEHFM